MTSFPEKPDARLWEHCCEPQSAAKKHKIPYILIAQNTIDFNKRVQPASIRRANKAKEAMSSMCT